MDCDFSSSRFEAKLANLPIVNISKAERLAMYDANSTAEGPYASNRQPISMVAVIFPVGDCNCAVTTDLDSRLRKRRLINHNDESEVAQGASDKIQRVGTILNIALVDAQNVKPGPQV